MKIIDADQLKQDLKNSFPKNTTHGETKKTVAEIRHIINIQPTASIIDDIMKELDARIEKFSLLSDENHKNKRHVLAERNLACVVSYEYMKKYIQSLLEQ